MAPRLIQLVVVSLTTTGEGCTLVVAGFEASEPSFFASHTRAELHERGGSFSYPPSPRLKHRRAIYSSWRVSCMLVFRIAGMVPKNIKHMASLELLDCSNNDISGNHH